MGEPGEEAAEGSPDKGDRQWGLLNWMDKHNVWRWDKGLQKVLKAFDAENKKLPGLLWSVPKVY